MIQEYVGNLLSITTVVKWTEVATDLVRFAPELLGGLTAVSLLFRKTRRKIKMAYYFSVKKKNDIIYFFNLASTVKELKATISNIDKSLATFAINQKELMEQFKVNGGKSTTDKLNKILSITIRSNARIKSMESNLPYATFFTDENGFFTDANDTLLEMTGRTIEELKDKNWINIIVPGERKMIEMAWTQALLDNRIFEDSFFILPTNSEPFKVKMIAKPVKDGEDVLGYSGVIKEIAY